MAPRIITGATDQSTAPRAMKYRAATALMAKPKKFFRPFMA